MKEEVVQEGDTLQTTEVAENHSEADSPLVALKDKINGATNFEEAILLQNKAIETLQAYETQENQEDIEFCNVLVEDADAKVRSLVQEGREQFSDTFSGQIIERQTVNGHVVFKAEVAQSETPNANKRIYPKEEFQKNLPRVRKECKAGKFLGLADHPEMFSGPSISRIAVKWTKAEMIDNTMALSGQLLSTDAGLEIAKLWDEGIMLEWSIRGWGRPEYQVDKKGNETGLTIIRDYFLDGCDSVIRGAAKTKTFDIEVDNAQTQPENEEVAEEETQVVEAEIAAPIIESVITPITESVEIMEDKDIVIEEVKIPEVTPPVDTDTIADEIAGKVEERRVASELKRHKEQCAAEVADSDEDFKELIAARMEKAATIEEVDAIAEKFTPKLQELKAPKDYKGIGIINRQRTAERNWTVGENIKERPETVEEVREQLLEGIEDSGGKVWGNKRVVFEKILDTYERYHPEYFEACTRRYAEASTTTAALTATGANLPMLLPLIRKVFPMLIPYEIASVQPLNASDGRVYTLDYKRVSDSTSFADSSSFDSTWADHSEAATKSQVKPEFTYTSLSATEKAIQYDITSTLMQDMKALHNVDAQAELLGAAADEIAREINFTFLELLRAGATASTLTYGTAMPTGYVSNLDWYEQLASFIAKAGAKISSKTYVPARYIICDPNTAPLLATCRGFQQFAIPENYGAGLTGTGQWGSTLKVYVADWFKVNTIMIVGKGDSWYKTGAVYAPYIPLYISPLHYDASTNTMQQSVSSRQAMAVLQGNCYATITVAFGTTGVAPFNTA